MSPRPPLGPQSSRIVQGAFKSAIDLFGRIMGLEIAAAIVSIGGPRFGPGVHHPRDGMGKVFGPTGGNGEPGPGRLDYSRTLT